MSLNGAVSRSSLRALLVGLALASPFASSCGCSDAPASGDPFGDAGARADGGAFAPCEVHDDCPLGMRCSERGCEEAARVPPTLGCDSDEQCEAGTVCAVSTGRCVAEPPPPATLPADAACADGETRACGTKTGACRYGVERCAEGAWPGTCEGGVAPTDEDCDGVDDDCDGEIDDIEASACFLGEAPCQIEGALSCAADGSGSLCVAPPAGGEVCNGSDDNGDTCVDEGYDLGTPCAVGRGACRREGVRVCSTDGTGTVCGATAGTPADEDCDGVDDDCDGEVDDGCDDDGDGYCDDGLALVGTPAVCPLTTGTSSRDCDDAREGVHPGATEVCDNTIDENCDGQLDEGCDAPVAVCDPASLVTEPFGPVTVDGSESSDGGGGALDYAWEVTSRPSGSTAGPATPDADTSSFTPDLAGSYELTLTVTNAQGLSDSCVVTVDVVPPGTIHVQLVWQESVGDLDLHLTKHDAAPVGAFFDATTGKDTWWAAPLNDWGTPASADGDASLDVDARLGNGPENINIDVDPEPGVYHVGVHVYCEQNQVSQNQFSGPEGPRNAKVRIYCSGELVDEIPVGWRRLDVAGAFWIPASIEWTGSACDVTRIDDVESGLRYCRALGGCGATATYGLTNDCRADRDCDSNADCRSYEVCLGPGNNKSCLVMSCEDNGDCPAGHRCAAEHGNVCTR